ncbi:hypothetical protein C8A01DRAFT_21157, partial [Parachaetomium inaequale]
DRPPTPSSIDIAIGRRNGLTIALDITQNTLQESKTRPTPSLKEMIETLSKENGRLREELVYYCNLQKLIEELRQEVNYATNRLNIAVYNFQKGYTDLWREFEGVTG